MILNYFQEEFRLCLQKGIFPEFEKVMEKTLFEFNTSKSDIDYSPFNQWFQSITGLSFLNKYFDNDVSEIITHSNKLIEVDLGKELVKYKTIVPLEDYNLSLEYFSLAHNQSWNYTNPFVSFQANINNYNCRVSMIHSSLSTNLIPKAFIRIIKKGNIDLTDFSIEKNEIDLIKNLIATKKNIIISGATGSGKTTFMKTLLRLIPESEHIITLEDTHELTDLPLNWTSLIADEKKSNNDLSALCAYALRMRPDRIILGEIRSKEAIPFMLSMNNGHRGLMATIHANSAKDTLSRLSLLFSLYSMNARITFETLMRLICQNIDYVIHVKNKKLSEIIEVKGIQKQGIPIISEVYSHANQSYPVKLVDHECSARNFC